MPSPPDVTPPTPSKTAEKQRDPFFDNAKFILVTLVVVGHSWTLLPMPDRTVSWAYDFLYAWHVPAFVLITGYLSRSFEWTRPKLWALVKTVAVPYVIFEALLIVFRTYLGGETFNDYWADPHWPMWYLSALFFWRLMTPIFQRLPDRAAVGTAVLISLIAGAFAPDFLDIARISGLLPFFVLGLVFRRHWFNALRSRRNQILAVLGFLAIFVLSRFTDALIRTEWLYYRSSYADLNTNDVEAVLIRSCLLLIGLTGSLAFLSLATARNTWFTRLGAASLVVYLFHGFFIKSAKYAGFSDWGEQHIVLGLLIVTVASVLLSCFLSWPPVANTLNLLIDPVTALARWVHRPVAVGHPVPYSPGEMPVVVPKPAPPSSTPSSARNSHPAPTEPHSGEDRLN